MVKFKKTTLSIVSVGLAACFSASIAAMAVADAKGTEGASYAKAEPITRLNTRIDNHTADYFNGDVVYRLSDNVRSNEEISVILSLNTKSALDAYLDSGSTVAFTEYLETASAKSVIKKNRAASGELKKAIDNAGVSYKVGASYENVISGFEVLIRAKDYYKLTNAIGSKARAIVGEVYAPAEAEIVTNDVDVYDTGIFKGEGSGYDGEGVVVAVLDTGLDYTHTAFSVDNFKGASENDAFTLKYVSDKINNLSAATSTANLTGENVFISRKVPYGYDYADKDPDVFPLDSEHGTHVAGVIAGKDDVITGVAPNAQLAIMKVFSDSQSGARTSWLIAALDDCVALGVDVINMSLGSAAGFASPDDNEAEAAVYEKIRKAGISLITAAGNEDNAVTGSEKNGSLPLTSNPDSGTVGSPSTYEAALSVASVGGVKTPYFLYNGEIMYFTEAATSSAKNKNFVDDILTTVGKDSYDFEYVTISGVGSRSDYSESKDYYKNKIVLVKRGSTTFEEKVDIALRIMGAAGIIIYNNVSGAISMQVGASVGAVCSITQDQGEKLAAAKTGIIRISRDQLAGPFMSDFSSWGPTSDLRIKPEITAHGGEIYSAVPGQKYDRQSGTSMAAPNMAGAIALIRQYVKEEGNATKSGLGENTGVDEKGVNTYAMNVTKRVNQLAMSTADIVRNKNGLAYAVRKQGAGLVNITNAVTSAAYVSTYQNGVEMDKTKLELGDDKAKTGVYEMSFNINNISGSSVSYNLSSIVMTEGVSSTYTSHGDTTVTTDGYALSPKTEIVSVTGDGEKSGSTITVSANKSATVTVKITLSDADKAYLDESFKNGMYVEGFISLKATNGTSVDLNVPFLAFYGDWTAAPIFDEEYYDTNADEINQGIDPEDKLMADAYATQVYGGYYSDYIAALGVYPFIQNSSAMQIAANKDHIALSNYEDGEASALNKIVSIGAGLLRNVKHWKLSIVEDATGEVIWTKERLNQRKSVSSGTTVISSNMEVDFSALDYNLKNNAKYTVTVEAYIDYGEEEEQNNLRNTFTFPLYIDFEAPTVTDVNYRAEYDKSTKKTRLYADVDIYDNHYTMATQFGYISGYNSSTGFDMSTFGKYLTPVFSSYNSTSRVTVELTDYVHLIKNSWGIVYGKDTYAIVENTNSFVVTCYDYAMNMSTYELRLPDEVLAMYFAQDKVDSVSGAINLSPNETLDLTSPEVLNIFPATAWRQVLDFESDTPTCVAIVNQTAIARNTGVGGTATVTATGKDANGKTVTAEIKIHVLSPDEAGYRRYDPPQVSKALISRYNTLKAFYEVSTSDRSIGLTGNTYYFGNEYELSMYPSESIELICEVEAYFPVTLKFSSSRSNIATVDSDGVVKAVAKGNASINVSAEVVTDKLLGTTSSYFVGTVNITVKDPYIANNIYLTSYRGNGGVVEIPADRGFTTIQSYAFSNYRLVAKDTSAGDIIDEEDHYYTKQGYIGDSDFPVEDRITKIVIPEGVTKIEAYAFAGLTRLTTVALPKSLNNIGVGAFYGCTNLTTINLENVQFINEKAFMNCNLAYSTPEKAEKAEAGLAFDSIVAIGSEAFRNGVRVNGLIFPATARSIDAGAFYGNTALESVEFKASQVKFGDSVFENCTKLDKIEGVLNALVIPERAFYNTALTAVTLGKDVSVINEEAFAHSQIEKFALAQDSALELKGDGKFVYKGDTLILVAPVCEGALNLDKLFGDETEIAQGAFAGNINITEVTGTKITKIGAYAFAECTNLKTIDFPNLEEIGNYAFYNASKLTLTSNGDSNQLGKVIKIGDWAFSGCSAITELNVIDDAEIGEYAFAACKALKTVTIGDNVKIGMAAFYAPEDENAVNDAVSYTYTVGSYIDTYYRYCLEEVVLSGLETLTVGDSVTIGDYAFRNNAKLTTVTLGNGAAIGDYAFYDAMNLTTIDLSKVKSIGEGAFSGSREQDLRYVDGNFYYAYEYAVINDQPVAVGYKYSYFAPKLTNVNLSGLDLTGDNPLGEGAFMFNATLKEVTLPEGITEIPNYAFEDCRTLDTVNGFESVTKIGDYAFMNTSVEFDLSDHAIVSVGDLAFGATPITAVAFDKNGATVGDSAFEGCTRLTTALNLDKVTSIGEWAFSGAALTEVDLSGAVEIGGFAFGGCTQLQEITLGEGLKTIGENPFFACPIASFAKVGEVKNDEFGFTETKEILTYDVNGDGTIKVIGGVLYKVVQNGGLELVCYPAGATAGAYALEENTVRIGARAFQGARLISVTLPRVLKAIGDKAFYNCYYLTTVIFNGYTAPILEEEFDESYMSYDNVAVPGYFEGYEGLGISDYYMWNATDPNNFYYGANFVTNIGYLTGPKLIMVSPANGSGYDTFIFQQYFDTFVKGSNAITDNTLQVIQMIASLNTNISLADEEAVEAARRAYEALPNLEQKALVSNYSKLTSAESTIEYLKLRGGGSTTTPPVPDTENDGSLNALGIAGFTVAGVLFVALAALTAYVLLSKKKAKGSGTNESDGEKDESKDSENGDDSE